MNDRQRDAITRAIAYALNLRTEPFLSDLDRTDLEVAIDNLNRIRNRWDANHPEGVN